jgi:hypothetical protein
MIAQIKQNTIEFPESKLLTPISGLRMTIKGSKRFCVGGDVLLNEYQSYFDK